VAFALVLARPLLLTKFGLSRYSELNDLVLNFENARLDVAPVDDAGTDDAP